MSLSNRVSVQIYDTKTIYSIGDGNEDLCSFDFSALPDKTYHPLFNTLPNLLYKKVKNCKFSCDLRAKYELSGKTSIKKEFAIKNSISSKNNKYIDFLVKIIKNTLPDSKKLLGISFSNIPFDFSHVETVLQACTKCKTLRSVSFVNISVEPSKFREFLSHTSPYQYTDLTFVNCGLNGDIVPFVKNYITKRPLSNRAIHRRLKSINLKENDITDDVLNEIDNLISECRKDHTAVSEYLDKDYILTAKPKERMNSVKPAEVQNVTSPSSDEEIDVNEFSDSNEKGILPLVNRTGASSEETPRIVSRSVPKRDPSSDSGSNYQESKLDLKLDQPNDLPHSNVVIIDTASDEYEEEEEEELFYDFEHTNPEEMNNEQLLFENERLRSILRNILKRNKGAIFDDDVFILGDGSEELVEVIRQMESQLQYYSQ